MSQAELNDARVTVALLCRELGAYRESLQPLSLASAYYSASVRDLSMSSSGDASNDAEEKQQEKFAEVLLLEIDTLSQLAEYEAAEKKIQVALKLAPESSLLEARIRSLEGAVHQRCGRFAQAKVKNKKNDRWNLIQ